MSFFFFSFQIREIAVLRHNFEQRNWVEKQLRNEGIEYLRRQTDRQKEIFRGENHILNIPFIRRISEREFVSPYNGISRNLFMFVENKHLQIKRSDLISPNCYTHEEVARRFLYHFRFG